MIVEEVSQKEFENPGNYKLMGTRVNHQFFYKLMLKSKNYYFSSVFEKSRFLVANINDDILICPDERVLIFSKDGDVLLALLIYESIDLIKYTKGFIFLFSERGMLKIFKADYCLYSVEHFSDIIVDIEDTNEGFKIKCFDERVFLVE